MTTDEEPCGSTSQGMLQPPKAEEAKSRSPQSLQDLDFRLLASRTVRSNFFCFKLPSLW